MSQPTPPDVAPPKAPAASGDGAPVPDADHHVRTDRLRSNLRGRSVRSGLVMMAAQPIKLALGIGAMAALARLLTPEAFGLIAMVAPLLVLVSALQNAGLESATVQREDATHAHVAQLFWLSLKVNAVVLGGMVLMAPVLAWFYGRSELVGITLALAVGVLALSVAAQHESLLKRQMRFEALTMIELGSVAAGVAVAVAAALLGAGYWALVLEVIVMQVVKAVALWAVCGWRPGWASRRAAALDGTSRAMLSYGLHLTGFRFVSRLGSQLDRVLIGYVSGAGALGLYDVARRWAFFPFDKVYEPVFDVAVSSFSRAQHDAALYRAYVRRGLLPVFALALPALAFAVVEADALILFLLGEQWTEAIPLFRLLAVAVFVGSLQRVTKWIYMAEGTTRRQLRWGLFSTPVMVAAVAVGALWGAYGVAVAFTLATIALTVPAVLYCLHTSPVSWRDIVAATGRPFAAAVGAAIVLVAGADFLPQTDSLLLRIAGHGALYGVLYGVLWLALPGGRRAAADLVRLLRPALRS